MLTSVDLDEAMVQRQLTLQLPVEGGAVEGGAAQQHSHVWLLVPATLPGPRVPRGAAFHPPTA
jgi:hypothetical protein